MNDMYLINADELCALCGPSVIKCAGTNCPVRFMEEVDAVPVVRCKDCKHWKHFEHLGCTDFVKVCGLANYMIEQNGYCLYGERKDGK